MSTKNGLKGTLVAAANAKAEYEMIQKIASQHIEYAQLKMLTPFLCSYWWESLTKK